MEIKCISLWQPYASLIAHGCKKIETRSWRCPLPAGTLLAIHAAKKWDEDLLDTCHVEPFTAALAAAGIDVPLDGRPRAMPFGAVLCVVRLGECLSTSEALKRPGLVGNHELYFGDYASGRFAWLLDAVVRFHAPVPERGRQSIWDWPVPPAVEPLLADLLPAAAQLREPNLFMESKW